MNSMLNRLQAKRAGERGFTLVELLVVILIIGILIAIALPTFLGQQDSANDREAESHLNTAYKVWKSEVAQGNAISDTALVAAITNSEPQLSAQTGDSSNTGAPTLVVVETANNAATGTNLEIWAGSDSGATCSGVVTAQGAPAFNCVAP